MSADEAYAAHKQMILRLHADEVKIPRIAAKVGFGLTPAMLRRRMQRDGVL